MVSDIKDKWISIGELVPVGVGVRDKIPGDRRIMARQHGSAKLVDRTTITINANTKQRLESLMCEGEIIDTTLLRILNEYLQLVDSSMGTNNITTRFDYKPLELICETHNGDKIIVPIARSKINFNPNHMYQDHQKQTQLEQERMIKVGMG